MASHIARRKFLATLGSSAAWPLDPRHPFYTGALPTERPRAPPTIDPVDGLIPE